MSFEHRMLPCYECWNFGPVPVRPRHSYLHPLARLGHINDTIMDLERQIEFMQRCMRRLALDKKKLRSLCPAVEAHVEGQKYIAKVPLGTHVKPDDLKISMSEKDHLMTIQAKREQKSKDGNSRVYQEFTRKFTLPEKVELKEVKTVLTPEGYLEIEAPVPALTPEEKKELENNGMTPEGFVDLGSDRNLKYDPPEGVEIPVTVPAETKPTGCVHN